MSAAGPAKIQGRMSLAEPVQVPSILRRLSRRDPWSQATHTITPYRGCGFACQYCYALDAAALPTRPRDRGQVRVQFASNGPFLLSRSVGSLKPSDMVLLGAGTDPYQPAEEEFLVTRRILELLAGAACGVHVLTRGALVTRDAELLASIAEAGRLCLVTISLPTVDAALARTLEPLNPPPTARLATLAELTGTHPGIRGGVAVRPILPDVTDGARLEDVADAAKANGGTYVLGGPLVLREGPARDRALAWANRTFSEPVATRWSALASASASGYWAKVRDDLAHACQKVGIGSGLSPDGMPSAQVAFSSEELW